MTEDGLCLIAILLSFHYLSGFRGYRKLQLIFFWALLSSAKSCKEMRCESKDFLKKYKLKHFSPIFIQVPNELRIDYKYDST